MKKITQNFTNVKVWQSIMVAFIFLLSLTTFSQTCPTDKLAQDTVVGDQIIENVMIQTTSMSKSVVETIPWSNSVEDSADPQGDLGTAQTGSSTNDTWHIATGHFTHGIGNDGLQGEGGNNYLFHDDVAGDSGNFENWVLTPTFDLSGATSPELNYWDHVHFPGWAVAHEVMYSTDYVDNGSTADTSDVTAATWVVLSTAISDNINQDQYYVGCGCDPNNTWDESTFTLPTDAAVTVAFKYVGDYASEWLLDDISVAEAPETGESLPWSDSFETSGIPEWTNDDANYPWKEGLAASYEAPPSAVQDGSSAVYFDDYSYSTGSSGTITSPLLDLTSATAPQLTFYYADNAATGNGDTVEVVLGDGTVIYTTPAETTDWELQTVDLTAYVGQSITIGFKGTSVYGYSNPHVDNVTVAEPSADASADWSVSTSGSDVTISITTTNFTVGAIGGGFDGHWHYTIDGGSVSMEYTTDDVPVGLGNDGEHTLVAWLVDDNHDPLSPAVEETITFWTFVNNECSGAIAIADGEQITGDTTNAADSGNNSSNDLWYSYTGNGQADDVTISLCGSSFDTYIRIFDACSGTEIAANDDSCGVQSEVTFTSDGTTTYYIMVEGYGSNSGAFVLSASSTLGIDDVDLSDLRIYPNPVDGNFVTILSPVNGIKYVQVFDINGRMVMDTSINNNTLDVSSINSGFYMIKVTINGQSKISKLVVR